jgi:hypothetical protein
MKTRLNENEVHKFVAKEIMPHVYVPSDHRIHDKLVRDLLADYKAAASNSLRTERGHLTRLKQKVVRLNSGPHITSEVLQELDDLEDTIQQKETEIEEIIREMESFANLSKKDVA